MERRDEVLRLLRITLRASQSIEDALKQDMSTYGLNWKEFVVLELLYNSGSFPTQEIGDQILLASSSLTYVLNKLNEKDYIVRITDKEDRRITHIEITESGRELMDIIFPKHADTIQEIYQKLSDKEIAELSEMLKTVGYTATEISKKNK